MKNSKIKKREVRSLRRHRRNHKLRKSAPAPDSTGWKLIRTVKRILTWRPITRLGKRTSSSENRNQVFQARKELNKLEKSTPAAGKANTLTNVGFSWHRSTMKTARSKTSIRMYSNVEEEVRRLFGSSWATLQEKTKRFVERHKMIRSDQEKKNVITMHLLDMQGWCP